MKENLYGKMRINKARTGQAATPALLPRRPQTHLKTGEPL